MSGSGISWAVCKSVPRSRQITTPAPHHSVFLQAGCPSCRPTTASKHWRHSTFKLLTAKINTQAKKSDIRLHHYYALCTDRSIIFARWHQHAPHLIHGSLGPSEISIPNGTLISSTVFVGFMITTNKQTDMCCISSLHRRRLCIATLSNNKCSVLPVEWIMNKAGVTRKNILSKYAYHPEQLLERHPCWYHTLSLSNSSSSNYEPCVLPCYQGQ